MNTLLGVALLAITTGVALWLVSRRSANADAVHNPAPPREGLLQIVLPEAGACEAALQLESSRFQKHQAPVLPLPSCDRPGTCRCRCRYVTVDDRRLGERRRGEDKREGFRYEEKPRRTGRGRRAQDKLWDHDGT